ncbi:MAG: carbonic anhydrase [Cyanobacteria bacterium SZAS-4]|nr:carbonic anhydrase [Cyanobacteria bacterium SZAS-4]
MKKLVKGLHHFQTQIFLSQRELFERLSKGQSPDALFITCSDSRINPNLITQTEPGELFILRNAGNIVPAYGASNGGEGATVELAVTGLGVKDIIVCGHSMCGAMDALLHSEKVKNLPLLSSWLNHAEATKRIAMENYKNLPDEDLQNVAVQENVLVQLENLRTHPSVAAKIARGELNLHAWVYKIETGGVFYYEPKDGQFEPLTQYSNVEDQKPSRYSFERLI